MPPDVAGTVTGSVTKRDRSGLPPGAVVSVQLQDVTLADAPATVLGEQVITTTGEQVPIPFEIGYDPAAVEERNSFAVRATITIDGALRYTSTRSFPVLTRGEPVADLEIVVEPVGPSGATPP
jgi:putative lipoprotein